jgi:hypothetical protein
MKNKISITLSSNVLARLDRLAVRSICVLLLLSKRFGMSCGSDPAQLMTPLIWNESTRLPIS